MACADGRCFGAVSKNARSDGLPADAVRGRSLRARFPNCPASARSATCAPALALKPSLANCRSSCALNAQPQPSAMRMSLILEGFLSLVLLFFVIFLSIMSTQSSNHICRAMPPWHKKTYHCPTSFRQAEQLHPARHLARAGGLCHLRKFM